VARKVVDRFGVRGSVEGDRDSGRLGVRSVAVGVKS
jgi:hypothetical protein